MWAAYQARDCIRGGVRIGSDVHRLDGFAKRCVAVKGLATENHAWMGTRTLREHPRHASERTRRFTALRRKRHHRRVLAPDEFRQRVQGEVRSEIAHCNSAPCQENRDEHNSYFVPLVWPARS